MATQRYRIEGQIYEANSPDEARAKHRAAKEAPPAAPAAPEPTMAQRMASVAMQGLSNMPVIGPAIQGGMAGMTAASDPMAALAGAAQGGSLNFADEIAAAPGTVFGVGPSLDETRQWFSEQQQRGPEAYQVGEVGGSLLTPVPGSTVMRGAKTLGGVIARGAGLGGAYGAAAEVGRSTDKSLSDVGTGALQGAAGGGILTAGLATLPLLRLLKDPGISTQARQWIAERARDAGITPQQASDIVRDLGPNAMLADVEHAFQNATAAVRSVSNKAASTVSSNLERRQAGAPARVEALVDQALPPGVGTPRQTVQEIAQSRRLLQPGYDDLSWQMVSASPELRALLQTEPGRAASREALSAWVTEQVSKTGKPPSAFPSTVDEMLREADGLPGRMVDHIHRVMRESGDAGIMASGAEKARARPFQTATAAMTDITKRDMPGYVATREAYGESVLAPRDALRESVRAGTMPETKLIELMERGQKAKGPERRAIQSGTAWSMKRAANRAHGAKGTGFAAGPLLAPPRESALDIITMGSTPAQKQKLMRGLESEQTFHDTYAYLSPRVNSRTANVLQAERATAQGVEDIALNFATGNKAGIIRSLSDRLLGRKTMDPKLAEEIASTLTQAGIKPDTVRNILRERSPKKVREILTRLAAPKAAKAAVKGTLAAPYLVSG